MSGADDLHDVAADETIIGCLDIAKPRSFFVYAGAGSGKTRSLVEAIRTVCERQGRDLSLSGQKIGVITYTNAACDEIKQRLEFDPRVEVSTIHAFAWSLISGYDNDIRGWLAGRLLQDIAELEEAQAKGRAASKAAADRARSIESKRHRHENLGSIIRFIYSPTGDNQTRDSLNHAEVIAMTADFLASKPGLRRLLVTRFPVLLIDESQDTSRQLMDVLLDVEAAHRDTFCLGLFGDMMQRIYADGKERLAEAIPEAWARPRKSMNHRCPTRVVELINRVRQDDDGEKQLPRSDAAAGTVRLFIAPQRADKSATEAAVAARMQAITGDEGWSEGSDAIKTLALEHLMSARRFGFERFFGPLYAVERIRTSFLQGTGAGIGFSRARFCRSSKHYELPTGSRSHRSFARRRRSSTARRLRRLAKARPRYSPPRRRHAMVCWPWFRAMPCQRRERCCATSPRRGFSRFPTCWPPSRCRTNPRTTKEPRARTRRS
jgi:DNA helicase-2/ATP-dependent DNA helicase PcrA